MLYDFFRFLRGVWEAVLLPFVILAIANLATDGWEAVIHLQDTPSTARMTTTRTARPTSRRPSALSASA